jgi:hypothetical protein
MNAAANIHGASGIVTRTNSWMKSAKSVGITL